jgi:UDP-GlcNAc:undecaprenyl-phosphate/decaprenyl-phosphate GlcNAc-1-phosphate transferase
VGQIAAALVLVVGGVGHDMASVVLTPLGIPFPPFWILALISAVPCVVIVIAACNATNLLDGLDGLCGGVTGIVTLGFLALAVFLATYQHFEDTADPLRVGLCLAMAGAVLGFLPYNIPPASIFMGDAGSMLLGFFVATMMALFCREHHARFLLGACAVFALPILDTALAVVRRLASGKSIFTGDRSHLYDQLVDRGMSVKQVVGLFYFLAVLAAAIGVVVSIYLRTQYAAVVYAVLLVIIWTAFYRLGMVKPEPRHPADIGGPDSQAR